MKTFFLNLILIAPTYVVGSTSTLPSNCIVAEWCLVSSTNCSFTRMLRPAGLYQGEAQYSTVRKGSANCQDYYGNWVNIPFQTSVEPVIFKSAVETEESLAKTQAIELCDRYQKQCVQSAPNCK